MTGEIKARTIWERFQNETLDCTDTFLNIMTYVKKTKAARP